MEYFTYVLYSPSFDKIYIGYSSDLECRIESHNVLSKKGWTIRYRPWVLIHAEKFSEKKGAILREKQLKTAAGRKFIWDLIQKKY